MKKLLEIFHACVENYIHAQVWTLFHVANQQSGRNQRLCYRVEAFISFFSPFPRVYKAKLTGSLYDVMMRLKISGRVRCSEVR